MTIVARKFASFTEGFALCYADEVSGETYFATFATAEPDPRRAAFWNKIALIENRTEAAIRPLAQALGVVPPVLAALRQSGCDEALANPILSWKAAMEEMVSDYPAYLDEFAQLKDIAPSEALDAMDLLYAHEVAMIEFAKLELAGDPHSIAPLDRYLDSFSPPS